MAIGGMLNAGPNRGLRSISQQAARQIAMKVALELGIAPADAVMRQVKWVGVCEKGGCRFTFRGCDHEERSDQPAGDVRAIYRTYPCSKCSRARKRERLAQERVQARNRRHRQRVARVEAEIEAEVLAKAERRYLDEQFERLRELLA